MNRSRGFIARRTAVITAVVAVGFLSLSTIVRSQVLNQVPSDALVVIKISNIRATSDKVAKYAEALGLAAVSPEFADPLGSLKEHLKIKDGLDEAGDMAFVVTRGAVEGNPDDAMMILMPVADFKAFVGNFAGAKTEAGISSFTPPDSGQELHAANWGKYAAVASNKELVSKKPAGLKLSGLAGKESKEKDAFVFANIPALAELGLPKLKEAREKGTEEIDKEFANNADAKPFAGVAKAAMGQVIGAAETFLKESTAASLSLHLNDEGLSFTMMTEFKPDSYAGKLAKMFKNTDQPLISGLPTARKYFAAGGVVNAPEAITKLVSDLIDPVTKELAATEQGKNIVPAVEAWKKSIGATKSFSFGYPMPTGAIGADSIIQSIVVMKGDSKAIAEGQKQVLTAVADVMKLAPKNAGADFGFEITPEAKTVGNVKLDSYEYKVTLDENNPQAAQAQQIMALVYGPGGMGGTYGAVDKDTFILVQGGTDKLLQDVVKAAPGAKDEISALAQVKRVSDQMPKQRMMAEYVFLDNVITAGVKYAKGFGMDVKLQLPPNLPPIGMTAATEGTAMRFDAFVPTQLVQSVVAAGMQAFMQQQGGGAGGNNDGL